LCLFGEHSDWAGGMRTVNPEIDTGNAIVVCTEKGIHTEVYPDECLNLMSIDMQGALVSSVFPMHLSILRNIAIEGGFFSYIAGTTVYMLERYNIGGLRLDCSRSNLHIKKGLASSAAVCIATARAFNKVYKLNLTTHDEIDIAYHGEQLCNSHCGYLDHSVAFGQGKFYMSFNEEGFKINQINSTNTIHIVYADLNAQKDTVSILRDLGQAYPYPKTKAHISLHNLFGKSNRRIVEEALNALSDGDAERVGQLMDEAQKLFDRYAVPLSPVELEAPKLHSLLNNHEIRQLIYGGKGVGSQGDGAVQFTARNKYYAIELTDYLASLGFVCDSVIV
jgi:mevalonate kinase